MNDTISRQAVADAINGIECTRHTTWYEFYQKVMTAVEKLPPAELGTNLASLGTDCISRQAAIDAFNTNIDELVVAGKENADAVERYLNRVIDEIKQLSPIQSKLLQPWEVLAAQAVLSQPAAPRRGKWIVDRYGIVICSECRKPRRDNRIDHIGWCNGCGAKMEVTT